MAKGIQGNTASFVCDHKSEKRTLSLFLLTMILILFLFHHDLTFVICSYQGYQFWTIADENGLFVINNIRTGDYNLYASVPGFIGDYKSEIALSITTGSSS